MIEEFRNSISLLLAKEGLTIKEIASCLNTNNRRVYDSLKVLERSGEVLALKTSRREIVFVNAFVFRVGFGVN